MILLGTAWLVAMAFSTTRRPPVVVYLLAGLIIGPSAFGFVPAASVELHAELALAALMLCLGLNFTLKEVTELKRPWLFLSFTHLIVGILTFFFLFRFALKLPWEKALFAGFVSTYGSVTLVRSLLADQRETETPYGKAASSILTIQNLSIIPILIATPFIVHRHAFASSFLESLFPLVLLMALAIILIYTLHKYFFPFLLDITARANRREIYYFTLALVLFSFPTIAKAANMSFSLGAFIAGIALTGSAHAKQTVYGFTRFKDALFSLFLVAYGTLIDLPFVFSHLPKLVLFTLAIVLVKFFVLFLSSWVSGTSSGVARATAAVLFQFGELSFLLAEQGMKIGLFSGDDRQYLLFSGFMTMSLTPFAFTRITEALKMTWFNDKLPYSWQKKLHHWREAYLTPLSQNLAEDEKNESQGPRHHIIIVGFGLGGQSLARVLKHLRTPYRVIEMNSETVNRMRGEYDIAWGDASEPQVLREAGLLDAKLVVCMISGANMLDPVLTAIHQLRPDVPIIARTNYILDLKRLPQTRHTDFVVSEFQSSLEIIRQTLHRLSVQPAEAEHIVQELGKITRADHIASAP